MRARKLAAYRWYGVFSRIFLVVILTDDGSEFTNPYAIEFDEEIMEHFSITRIAANDVTLKPSLLGIEVAVKEKLRGE